MKSYTPTKINLLIRKLNYILTILRLQNPAYNNKALLFRLTVTIIELQRQNLEPVTFHRHSCQYSQYCSTHDI